MSQIQDATIMIALAEERHFGKAAERCHMSSSAMTRAVQRIESQLAVALFERDNRSVSLTPHGEQYLKFCRKTLAEWEILQSRLRMNANAPSGQLSVYCSVTAVYSLLEPLVSACREKYPDIELLLHTGDQADAVQRVLEHREQVAIAACPPTLPDSLEFLPILSSPFVLIQPKELSTALEELMPTDVARSWSKVPVVLPERGLGRERMEQFFKQMKQKPNIYANVTGHEAVVAMVALGCGIGGVPKIVVDSSPQRDRVAALESPKEFAPFEIGLICHKRQKQNAIVRAFWELAEGTR